MITDRFWRVIEWRKEPLDLIVHVQVRAKNGFEIGEFQSFSSQVRETRVSNLVSNLLIGLSVNLVPKSASS